jgi:hypothetical protein
MSQNMPKILIPVVIIVFNRSDLTKILLEKLSQFNLSKLYVIMDGARNDNANDKIERDKILNMLENISFSDKIEMDISDNNLGCRDRVVSGLDWVFKKEESAIILEDDCIPSDTFLEFCQNMINEYKDDERIGVISGTNLIECKHENNAYHFSKYCNIWGWATWRRVWCNYDVDMKILNDKFLQKLQGRFDYRYEYKYWRAVFNQTKNKDINTWDYQLWLSVWSSGQISIVPSVNQIDNLGFQHVSATHTGDPHPAKDIKARNLTFPLIKPNSMLPDTELDKKIFNLLYRFPSIYARVKNKLIRIFSIK